MNRLDRKNERLRVAYDEYVQEGLQLRRLFHPWC